MPVRDQQQQSPAVKPPAKKSAPPKKTQRDTSPIAVREGTIMTVSYELSVTKKMSDFEFVKMTAGATVPVDATDEELARVDDMMVVLKERVTDHMTRHIQEVADAVNR